jgi:hypothetical protein
VFTRFVQRLRKEKRRMKSKFVFGLLAMMLVLALAPSSFAQVNIQIFGAPSAQEVQTVRAAQAADPLSEGAGLTVSGAVIANVELTTTRLDITYPGPLTSSPTVPAGDPLRIEGATGLFSSVSISTILFASGVIQVTLPECKGTCATTTPSGSFRIVAARVDVNGKTAPLQASASLANTANGYINSSSPATVINALGPGIASMVIGARSSTATNLGTATIFTNAAITDSGASVTITEGFASAWRANTFPGTATAVGRTTSNPYQIRLTVAGLATGQSLSVATAASGTLSFSLSGTTFTSTTTTRTLSILASSLTAVENMQLDFTVTAPGTAPLTPAAITLTATMAPIGDQLINTAPSATNGYPTFAQADVGPVTIANVVPATTTLLIPFAVRDGGFDTGISLANTTADPFGSSGGATAQSGTVRVDFFPRLPTGGAGTTFSLTSSATARPGIGLSADGTLAAGATWTVLLSELLTAAGQTGSFTGYIFLQTNFLLAHGAPFVSDFRNFTSFTPMLVLPPPISNARTTTEILAF